MADNRDPKNGGSDKEPNGNPWMKSLLIWAGILLALVLFVQIVEGGGSRTAGNSISYSEFLDRVDQSGVKEVAIGKDVITGRLSDGTAFKTNAISDPELANRLRSKNVNFTGQPEQTTSVWLILLYQSLPFLLILGIAFFIMRQMQKNAGSGAMGFGRSKAKLLTE